MTGRQIAGVVVAMGVVFGAYVTACRPADAAKTKRIDTTELARRQARVEQALGRPQSGRSESVAVSRAAGTLDVSSDTGDTGVVASSTTTADSAKEAASDNTGTKRAASDRRPRDKAIARWVLPRELDEISGIALTPDGRLLAHGDERGQVSEIDYRRGVIIKQFVVGRPTVRADLEGITVANDVVFMLTDKGVLYEFREGANGARVGYITYDTRLGKECEFEGLAYDAKINSLLLACKEVKDNKRLRADSMVIYGWKLAGGRNRISRITAPLSRILPVIKAKEFHPAEITVDPHTGNYVIVASIERALVEITPAGQVISARKLTGQHDQPESLAITKDGILIIGDEAGRRPAAITLYPWPL